MSGAKGPSKRRKNQQSKRRRIERSKTERRSRKNERGKRSMNAKTKLGQDPSDNFYVSRPSEHPSDFKEVYNHEWKVSRSE